MTMLETPRRAHAVRPTSPPGHGRVGHRRGRRAAPPPPTSVPALTRWITTAVALLALWLVAYGLVLSGIQQQRAQHGLYATFREQLALATAPVGGTVAPGTPVAMLSVPRLGLRDLVVVEGTASGDLRSGPGHRRDTALPGQPGVAVVFGKAATFGAPFRDVPALRPGDVIRAVTAQGEFEYRVQRLRRAGDPVVPPAAGTSRLTLVTGEGSGWRGGWAPTGTVYADAVLRGTPQPAPPGRPTAIPAAETAMHVDAGALMPLVLWLEALLAAALGLVWAAARWGRWQTWMVGGVVLLALVWGSSSTAARLLPNLL